MTVKSPQYQNELFPVPVVPGDRLGSERDFFPGYGTYASRGFIHSAVVGFKAIQPGEPPTHDASNVQAPVVG